MSASVRDGFILNLITSSREDMLSWSPICSKRPKVCYCHNLYEMMVLYEYLRPWNIARCISLDLEGPKGGAQRALSFVRVGPLVLSKRCSGQLCRWKVLCLAWARISAQPMISIWVSISDGRKWRTKHAALHTSTSVPQGAPRKTSGARRDFGWIHSVRCLQPKMLRKHFVSAYSMRRAVISFLLTNAKVHVANVNWSWWT